MQFLLVFASAFLADFLAGIHLVTLMRRRVVLAMLTGPLPLLLSSVGLNYYVEAEGRWERFAVVLCEVAGILAGVPVTLALTRRKKKPLKKRCPHSVPTQRVPERVA